MLAMLEQNAERVSWTARQWAAALGCSTAAVHGTAAWRRIMTARALHGAARLEDD
jgi:hypothetical protein